MLILKTTQLSVPQRLWDLALAVRSNEIIGIIGPNGAGKSTLLKALAGLQAYQGQVCFRGRDLAQLARHERAQAIGYLPQQSQSYWALTVQDIVRLGRLPWGDQNEKAVAAAMAAMQITPHRHMPIHTLSGGEQARVWLARVLAGEPSLLLADEPTASLDLRYQKTILQALRAFATQQRSVVLAIHDLNLAAQYCDKLGLMEQGRLVAFGAVDSVLQAPLLSRVYQVAISVGPTLASSVHVHA